MSKSIWYYDWHLSYSSLFVVPTGKPTLSGLLTHSSSLQPVSLINSRPTPTSAILTSMTSSPLSSDLMLMSFPSRRLRVIWSYWLPSSSTAIPIKLVLAFTISTRPVSLALRRSRVVSWVCSSSSPKTSFLLIPWVWELQSTNSSPTDQLQGLRSQDSCLGRNRSFPSQSCWGRWVGPPDLRINLSSLLQQHSLPGYLSGPSLFFKSAWVPELCG